MELTIQGVDKNYEIPRIYEFIENNEFEYEESFIKSTINPNIEKINLPHYSNHVKWAKLNHYGFKNGDPNGFYINSIKDRLKHSRIRVKIRYMFEVGYLIGRSNFKIGPKSYFFTDNLEYDDSKIKKYLYKKNDIKNKISYIKQYKYIYSNPEFMPKLETILHINNEKKVESFQEYRFYIKCKNFDPFLETDQMMEARLSEYGINFPTIISTNNMTEKRSIGKLSELSKKKNILTFLYRGLIIKLLPPLKGHNYFTYDEGVYVNGIEQRKIHNEYNVYNKWFTLQKDLSDEDNLFRDCWRTLLYLNRNLVLPDPKEDILWKYLIDIQPWNKYLDKFYVHYTLPDGTVKTDEIFELNSIRARQNVTHKNEPLVTKNKVKYTKINKIYKLVS